MPFFFIWSKCYKTIKLNWQFGVFFFFPIQPDTADSMLPELLRKGTILYQFYILSWNCYWFFADAVLMYVFIRQSKADSLTKSLEETENMQRLKELHTQEIEKRREELTGIRLGYNSQIVEIIQLLNNEQKQEAARLLDQLTLQIEHTKENSYCGNNIVNAVIAEKKHFCKENGIELETEVEVLDKIKISPIHICSLFSNLLDNAIHASMECDEDNRKISLHAGYTGSYWTLRISNFALPLKKNKERRGYGMEIIADITKAYQGEYIHEYKDGQYRVIVSLLVG